MKKLKILLVFTSIIISIMSCEEERITNLLAPEPSNEDPLNMDTLAINKKGACFTKKGETWSSRVSRLKVHWHYSWGSELSPKEPDNVEFVPMIWGKSGVDSKITGVKKLKDEKKVKYLLGFNEPDGEKQANMSVDEAIALWPKLESAGLLLGSPAPVGTLNEWLINFMNKADANNYRVDFICMHWYGGKNPQSLLDKIKQTYDKYKKPIWITEFAVADWNAATPADNKYTPAEILAFMKEVLPKLEELPYVHKYAWFNANTDNAALCSSVLFDENDNLTPLGEFYASFKPNENIGPGKDDLVIDDDPDNMIKNGNFESGDRYPWNGYKSSVIGEATTTQVQGDYCARIENSDGSLYQTVDVEAGKKYEISFKGKWSESVEETFSLNIKNEEGDKASIFTYPVPKSDNWEDIVVRFLIPDGVSKIRFVLYKGKGLPSYFVDDVKMKETDGELTVTDIPVEGVSFENTQGELTVGSSYKLTATITPENATNKNITWSSSDNNIATVDSDGNITAVSAGDAIITATTEDGNKTATYNLTVKTETIAIESITLSAQALNLEVGNSSTLTYNILPSSATNKNVVWSSSDESVATVNQNGVVSAISEGNSNITVTTEDGNKTSVCVVTVNKPVIVNIVTDGDFEAGDGAAWSGFKSATVGVSTTTPKTGAYCGRIGNNDGSLFQVVTVEAGKTYNVSFFSKWSVATTKTFDMKIKEEGGAKAVLASHTIPTDTEWVENTAEFTVPAGVTKVRFLLYKGKTNPAMPTFFVDDIVISNKQ